MRFTYSIHNIFGLIVLSVGILFIIISIIFPLIMPDLRNSFSDRSWVDYILIVLLIIAGYLFKERSHFIGYGTLILGGIIYYSLTSYCYSDPNPYAYRPVLCNSPWEANKNFRLKLPFSEFSDLSKFAGRTLVLLESPSASARVDMNKPLEIRGKAKRVFKNGEFQIIVRDNQGGNFSGQQAFAICPNNNCDWNSDNYYDFKSTLDISSSRSCNVTVEFYHYDNFETPFYSFPSQLYGLMRC